MLLTHVYNIAKPYRAGKPRMVTQINECQVITAYSGSLIAPADARRYTDKMK